MATNWIVPTKEDVKSAFAGVFVEQNNGEDFDPDALADAWLPIIVAQVRAAIQNGNRNSLSITKGSIPPEAKAHTLALTAEAIIVNSQRMVAFIVLDGENGPMARMIVAARKFLSDCARGANVVDPLDPDPATLPSGVIWGDDSGIGSSATVQTDLSLDAPPY